MLTKGCLLHCRDAVISGGFLYVLAVTLGDMPKEGLSGSGNFQNGGGAVVTSDIYVAKIDLSEWRHRAQLCYAG
jgi:hypothetical protein